MTPGRGSRQDEGAVAVLVAICTLLFMVLAAFALDIGNAYAQGRQLSVAADAAALAAAAKVGESVAPGLTCEQGLASINEQAIAKTTADEFNTQNNKSNSTGVAEPVDSATVTCVDTTGDGVSDSIEVTVNNSRAVKTALAGVIGIDEITPNATAVARYVRTSSSGGLRPWAVCDKTVKAAQDSPDTTFWTGIDKIAGPCDTSASGNWGSVDFDGGGNSAVDLARWTALGYPGRVPIPSTIPADPGVSNSADLKAAFENLVGQVVQFPSVTGFGDGGGNNANFPTLGITTVRVCGIMYGNNTYNTVPSTGLVSDCWVNPGASSSSTTTTSTTTATTGSINKNSDSLLVAALPAFPVPTPDQTITLDVTVVGAGAGGKDLSTTAPVPANPAALTLVLDADAKTKVVNAAVTIKVNTTTTTLTPGFVPLGGKKPIDHIQFRWVGYSTATYTGTTSDLCNFTNRNCAGATILWR